MRLRLLILFAFALICSNSSFADPATPHQGVKKPGTPKTYSVQIDKATTRWENFPKTFFIAILHVESRFDPGATSRTGAAGIGQFTSIACKEVQRLSKIGKYRTAFQNSPTTLEQLQKFDQKLAYDPDIAIEASALLIQHLLGTYKADLPATATAYNAGTKAARAVLTHGFQSAKEQGLLTFSQASTYWPHVREAMLKFGGTVPKDVAIVLTALKTKRATTARITPGGKKTYKLKKNLCFVIKKQEKGYFLVDFGSEKLWIKSKDCKRLKKASIATISTELLNGRKGPSTKFAKIGQLNRGQRVVILEQQSEWLKVQFGAQTAWIFSGKSYVIVKETD